MENLIDAHYFSLPTQGNIYSFVNLCLTSGINKALIASLKRKVFCCEFQDKDGGNILPLVKEVPFTYIPSGAEIISVDAFNRALTYDDFLIGITILKVNGEQNVETYLNIYTEQELDETSELNLDSIAQNCLMLELSFIPYQLYHTELLSNLEKREVVWLLCGGDAKVHLFREDPQNHAYSETEVEELFPEFSSLPSIAIWIDVKHTSENKRLSGIGFECGLVKFCAVDPFNCTILLEVTEQFDAPVACVGIFRFIPMAIPIPECLEGTIENDSSDIVGKTDYDYHLVAVNTLQPSVVYMNILKNGLSRKLQLPDSDKYDATLTACIGDLDMDGEMEILLGTYSQVVLMYKFEMNKWVLRDQKKVADPVHSIDYRDFNGDGVKEVLLLTLTGIHILQHNPADLMSIFIHRLGTLNNEIAKI